MACDATGVRPGTAGVPCDRCGGHKVRSVTACARSLVSRAAWDAMGMWVEYDQQHMLPCAGGTLDQTASFRAAMRFIRSDLLTIEAGLNGKLTLVHTR